MVAQRTHPRRYHKAGIPCPRCNGSALKQQDEVGNKYFGCIACGWLRYIEVAQWYSVIRGKAEMV